MNKSYFQNDKNYDGQVVGVQGVNRIEIREYKDLIFLTVLSSLGNVALSKEYIQDDLADVAPTISLYAGFTNLDVAQLATEAELNAKGIEGKWDLAAPAADTVATVISDMATNTYFGHIGGNDAAALASVAALSGMIPVLYSQSQQPSLFQPGGLASVGGRFLNAIGL